jgi:hypothetical protein
MRFLSSIAGLAMIIAGGTGSMAAELPGFEVTGFPISPVQAQLLGAANVQEQAPEGVVVDGAPASPHQVGVLTPRPRQTADVAVAPAAGLSSRAD